MGRATGALVALALVAASAQAAVSQMAAPPGFTVADRTELAGGVEYLKLTKPGPVAAHIAHLAPGASVDLHIVNAADRLSTNPADLETTSSMCGRVHCIVGVNGDFHDNGVPVGGVITDGRMLQSPDPARPQLTVTRDGHLTAGVFPWTGSVTFPDGTQIPLGAVNRDPPGDGLTVYTPDYGPATPASNRTELILGTHGPLGTLNQPANVDLRGIRTGAGPIPADGAVLAGDGAAAQQLVDAWARKGMTPRGRVVVNSPVDAGASLGAYPVLLHNGQKATPFGNDPNLIFPQQPHTLVAWNRTGDVYLVAVDGRQAASVGMTMAEAADFALGLGATEAVNLDGGGGTTFVTDGAVRNRPSDNDPNQPANYFERSATNALVVLPRPGSPTTTTTMARAVTPFSAAPTPPSDGTDDPAPGAADAPSSTSPDGGAAVDPAVDPAGGPVAEADSGGIPIGPAPSADTASPASGTAALKLKPSNGVPARGEEALATPTAEPATGAGAEVHRVTEALRAPLSVATSVTGDLVDAAIGGDAGLGSKARRTGAGLAGVLAMTAVATRRRRRRGAEPVNHNAAPAAVASLEAPLGPAEGMPERSEVQPAEPAVVFAQRAVAPKPVYFREVRNDRELRLLAAPDGAGARVRASRLQSVGLLDRRADRRARPCRDGRDQAAWGGRATPDSQTSRTSARVRKRSEPLS